MKDAKQVKTIYRAKKTDSDEWTKGFLCNDYFSTISIQVGVKVYRIDPSTLSIHFTNSHMEDSKGIPIFASLSSDGNGGDRLTYPDGYNSIGVAYIKNMKICARGDECYIDSNSFTICKVTGIHTVKEER